MPITSSVWDWYLGGGPEFKLFLQCTISRGDTYILSVLTFAESVIRYSCGQKTEMGRNKTQSSSFSSFLSISPVLDGVNNMLLRGDSDSESIMVNTPKRAVVLECQWLTYRCGHHQHTRVVVLLPITTLEIARYTPRAQQEAKIMQTSDRR